MSDITPALTPAQWAGDESVIIAHHPSGKLGWFVSSGVDPDGVLRLSVHGNVPTWTLDESRHALTALALHEQPFGFTWHDVQLLEHYASVAPEAKHFADLAARIAALLPPR